MKKILAIFSTLIFVLIATFGQNKINFKNKKISELGVNMGMMYGVEEFSPTFPLIWKDFDPNSDNYVFSGFYTLAKSSDNENKILNGEVKLIRLQTCIAEGTINIKEELTFNFTNGNMNGPITYFQYSSDCNGETNETDLKTLKWKKDISISANYLDNGHNYKNIGFSETREWEKTKYTVSQGSGDDISLDYFRTVININTSSSNEKPVFKKIRY